MVWWWIFRFMDSNSYKAFCLRDTRDTPLISHRIYPRRGGSQTLLKGQMNRQKGATALSNLALAMGTAMWLNQQLVGGLEHELYVFPYNSWEFIIPTDFHSSFFRGVTEIPAVFQLYIDQQVFWSVHPTGLSWWPMSQCIQGGAPQTLCLLVRFTPGILVRYITNKNHSEIGVMFTNWTLSNGGTTL